MFMLQTARPYLGKGALSLSQHRLSQRPAPGRTTYRQPFHHPGGTGWCKRKSEGEAENLFKAGHSEASLMFFPVSGLPVDVTKWEGAGPGCRADSLSHSHSQ